MIPVVAALVAAAVALLTAAAEYLQSLRVRRVAGLAFGPKGRPAEWTYAAPLLRVAGSGALAWGLVALLLLPPKEHAAIDADEMEERHLLLVLDVSPSMRLQDSGPTGKQSRRRRAADLLASAFERVPISRYRTTIIAFYTDAKPVVKETKDLEVVRNILEDLPMEYAFKAGKTDVFAGLQEAARIAHPWRPNSAVLMLVSDGDTVAATGMPKLPASIEHVVLVGVGDPNVGKFIDGHQSRQDASTLRQVAVRLKGTYHNGNEKHLATDLLREISGGKPKSLWQRLTLREWAMIACGTGAGVLALLPVLLHYFGTRWRPGVPERGERLREASTHGAALARTSG
jgi:Ca-activated chloride channel family protein